MTLGPAAGSAPALWSVAHRARAADMAQLVAVAAADHGDRVFIQPAERGIAPVTFRRLEAFAAGLDAYLESLGVPRGATVTTLFHNSTLAALLFLGTLAGRRVLVPLNPKLGAGEIGGILARTAPAILIHEAAAASRVPDGVHPAHVVPVADQGAFMESILALGGDGRLSSRMDLADADPGRDAEIVFTSGSSGPPKGVVLPHRSLLSDSFALGGWFGIGREDTFLTACPLFHNSGQVFTTLTPLWSGGRTTAVRSEVAMLRFWPTVAKFAPTWTLVVNAYMALLAERPQDAVPTGLKGLLSGGSRLDGELIARFETAFSVPVHQVYGLTETTSVATVEAPNDPGRVLGSAGRTLPICRIRIVAEDGTDQPVGENGEVWIRGENLLTRYHEDPDLTARQIRDGWLRTGDIGHLDSSGNLFIVERLDSMLFVGGENVYPSEVENLVPELEGIEEAVLSHVPDPVMGSELVLVYGLAEGALPRTQDWLRVLRAKLSTFKVPKRLVPVTDLGIAGLPRAANGKILRRRVEELLAERVRPSEEDEG
ncbi:acyl--CoA ligase [Streptomyces lavenduligriseus]|uniref:class I adenylate-forming enzyme family protein n=1 Tax=Streptomyces eurythermus TaxID=42237 RepID=UPI0027A0D69C|nr:acyl--CoA ligase [Streptomyces lavenduligriseus]